MNNPGALTAALPQAFKDVLGKIEANILNPLILLLFGIATVVFMWGVVKYIANADNESERSKGSKAIVYGIVGMFVMFSVFGIMNLIANTVTSLGQ